MRRWWTWGCLFSNSSSVGESSRQWPHQLAPNSSKSSPTERSISSRVGSSARYSAANGISEVLKALSSDPVSWNEAQPKPTMSKHRARSEFDRNASRREYSWLDRLTCMSICLPIDSRYVLSRVQVAGDSHWCKSADVAQLASNCVIAILTTAHVPFHNPRRAMADDADANFRRLRNLSGVSMPPQPSDRASRRLHRYSAARLLRARSRNRDSVRFVAGQ